MAFSIMACILIGRVLKLRNISQPSKGAILAPRSSCSAVMIASMIFLLLMMTPATTSLCPPRYFDAECTSISTPRVNGFWNIGDAQVLSITVLKSRSGKAILLYYIFGSLVKYFFSRFALDRSGKSMLIFLL